MEFAAIINNALLKSQENTLAKTNYKWRFVKAVYQADIYNSSPFTLLEEVVCEILLNHGGKSFIELGSILGLSVENRFEDRVYKDVAEEQILREALKSLSEDHIMLQLVDNRYGLTKWGLEFTSKRIKLSCRKGQHFDLYFDTLSAQHQLIHRYFKNASRDYQAEESDWDFPSEDLLKEVLRVQAPDIYNPETNKLAFYADLVSEGFKECYADVEVHALKKDSGFELKVYWQNQYNEELSAILNNDERAQKEIITDLSFELASKEVITPDAIMLEVFKSRWNWASISSRNLNFTADLLEEFYFFWDWDLLSANPHVPFSDEVIIKFEDKWSWDKLTANASFSIDIPSLEKYAAFLNLNKAIERLSEDQILSPRFYTLLERYVDRLAPLALEKVYWSNPVIDLFDSFDKIRWQSKRWVTVEIHSRFKLWEGSEEYEVSVPHHEPGLIDNAHLTWSYDLLHRYWDRINYEELDLTSQKAFSDRISRDSHWHSLQELSEFRHVINWDVILQNPSVELNEEFLTTFKDSLNWHSLTKIDSLTHNEHLLEIFRDSWNWSYISKDTTRKFGLPFLMRFADYVDWNSIVHHPLLALTQELLHTFKNYFDWTTLSASNRINYTTTLLEEFKCFWNWNVLSSNKGVNFDNIKLDRFKDYWNWEKLSENCDIVLDSFNLQEFDSYWNWNQLATPPRINKFLNKFSWQNLPPAEHRELILRFAGQYNEAWVWGILKHSSYISLDDAVLGNLKTKAIWDEIVLDERFRLSDRNLELYAPYLSWDSLSANPRIVRPNNIARFKDSWNWDILSSNTDLIHDTNLLWKHRESWNWNIVSKTYSKFSEDVLLTFGDYWNLGLIDYDLLPFTANVIELFKDKWDWDRLSSSNRLKFDLELVNQYYLRWNWELLSLNKALPLDKFILIAFSDKWVLNKERYNSIPFDQDLLKVFVDRLDWKNLSSKSYLQFDIPIISEFVDHWDWELLSQNCAIDLNTKMLHAFSDRWVLEKIDYTRISFNKTIVDLFADRLDWHELSSHAKVEFSYDLLQSYREHWDWKQLSLNPALNLTVQLLRHFCGEWNWTYLSQRKGWDFAGEHDQAIIEFEEYWDWSELLKFKKYRNTIKEQFPKIYSEKIQQHINLLDLSLRPLNLSKEHDPYKIYVPSPIINNVFEEKIINAIKRLPKTQYYHEILGRDSHELRRVINYGRADFDQRYEDVTAEQKVLVYCYLNMRKHFFTKLHILNMLHKSVYGSFFEENLFQKETTIIDVGCGPLTAGLAYADYTRSFNQQKLTYHGVDISSTIMKKAEDFASSSVFKSGSSFSFYNNWRSITPNFERGQPLLFIFSYLFANLTKQQTDDLAEFTQSIIEVYQLTNPIFLMFQNPDDNERNEMFYRFLRTVQITVIGEGNDDVTYSNRIKIKNTGNEQVKYVIMASPSTANRLILQNLLSGKYPEN